MQHGHFVSYSCLLAVVHGLAPSLLSSMDSAELCIDAARQHAARALPLRAACSRCSTVFISLTHLVLPGSGYGDSRRDYDNTGAGGGYRSNEPSSYNTGSGTGTGHSAGTGTGHTHGSGAGTGAHTGTHGTGPVSGAGTGSGTGTGRDTTYGSDRAP